MTSQQRTIRLHLDITTTRLSGPFVSDAALAERLCEWADDTLTTWASPDIEDLGPNRTSAYGIKAWALASDAGGLPEDELAEHTAADLLAAARRSHSASSRAQTAMSQHAARRNRAAAAAVAAGVPVATIATELGVDRQRVYQMIKQHTTSS